MYTQHIHTPWWVVVRVSAYWLKDSMKEDHSKRKKIMFKNIYLFIWSKHLTSIIQLSSQEKPKILHTNKKYLRFTTFYEHLLHIQTPTYGTNISHYCSSRVNIFHLSIKFVIVNVLYAYMVSIIKLLCEAMEKVRAN